MVDRVGGIQIAGFKGVDEPDTFLVPGQWCFQCIVAGRLHLRQIEIRVQINCAYSGLWRIGEIAQHPLEASGKPFDGRCVEQYR
ncbi:hypothetical protein PSCICP_39790 [Pseudomonas cichorii]|uniref:Uncharacterized protein n=1 Tax=Pseudomonas cichorii TaxID=36746 RepID=A0ABQ1DSR1_PSECI|nr:hypothetical protein PSCICP_39790 [Pseudomonas cichorii]